MHIKSFIYKFVAAIGLPHLLHNWFSKGRVSILMYHGVISTDQELSDWCCMPVDSFREQIRYLKKHFNIVSLSDAVNMLESNKIDCPTAVITFDDGYQNNYDVAYPILLDEHVPATIFLSTGLIDTDSTIWTGLLHNAFSKTIKRELTWSGCLYDISTNSKKQNALKSIKRILKKHHHSAVLVEVKTIVSELMGSQGFEIGERNPYRMLNSSSIHEMQSSGLIEFGGHTLSHPILRNLDSNEQQEEICQSIKDVHELTGRPCTSFAYPNGSVDDYNDDSISILRESGINVALTTIQGTCSHTSPTLQLRRFGLGSDVTMANFKLMVHNMLTRNS